MYVQNFANKNSVTEKSFALFIPEISKWRLVEEKLPEWYVTVSVPEIICGEKYLPVNPKLWSLSGEARLHINNLLFYLQIKYAYLKRTVCSVLENIKNFTFKAKIERRRQVYRVIHKSVKYLKNSQQIHYSTDHGSS